MTHFLDSKQLRDLYAAMEFEFREGTAMADKKCEQDPMDARTKMRPPARKAGGRKGGRK